MKIHILLAATLLAVLLLEVEGHRGGGWRRRGGEGGGHRRGGRGGEGHRPGHGHKGPGHRHRRPDFSTACNMPVDSGDCDDNEGLVWRPRNMYFYNSTSEQCEEFSYSGCGGNLNRFWSLRSCTIHCSDPCDKPLEKGDEPLDNGDVCKEGSRARPRTMYYYDAEENLCKEFEFTGCGGNKNRFRSARHCDKRCMDSDSESADSDDSDEEFIDTDSEDFDEDFLDEIDVVLDNEEADDDDDRSRRSLGGRDLRDYWNRCGRVQCMIHCEYGRKINPETGCPMCSCNGPPTDELPRDCPPLCRRRCPFGNVIDRNTGCPLCQCKPAPILRTPCRPLRCRLGCRGRGYATDENGCRICRCRDELETPNTDGEVEEEEEEVRIIRRRCPMIKCRRQCQNGFKRNAMGCGTCECNAPGEDTRPLPEFFSRICKPIRCLMLNNCPFGRAVDDNGCETCNCASPPFVPPTSNDDDVDDVCSQHKVTGPCMAYFPRFYYNSDSRRCERFVYGGCRANGNNFRTMEACQERCEH